ncbi:uncharacterized protein [Littorina saxatilis]|uniref:uncharacterized protein n=1 Tax=Littorina saxatilis TaxID=31220 RepID=UPI0038B59379
MNMTIDGIVFMLEAYPVPHDFAFTYLDKGTITKGSRVSSDNFHSTCQQDRNKKYILNCSIKPVYVPRRLRGMYLANVSNGIGSVEVAFQIRIEVVEERTHMVWTVVGATAAVVVFVLFIIIIVLARRRCLARRTPQVRREKIVESHEEVELNPIRRQRQQPDQSHQDSDDNIQQPELPPAGIPISDARSRQMSEEENHYTRISDSSSLSYEHAYAVTQRRGSRDEHCYTDLALPL